VPRASTVTQKLRVDALSIISDQQAKLAIVISDYHIDPLRLRVLKGIAQGLSCDPVNFVSQDRMKLEGREHELSFS